MNDRRDRLILPFAIVIAILAVSTASIFVRFAQREAPSIVIAALRLGFAVAAITPFAITRYRSELRALTRHELLLPIVGGVFVMEAVSVLLQVGYYKLTGGKRIFHVAPIHHHFHLKGWSEPQVVIRFWLLGVACAAAALATLKLR